jgi:superfamily II DNA or RNA helicase
MKRDQVAQMKVEILHVKHTDADRKLVKGLDYQGEIDFLVKHEKRNKFVARLASALPGNTLVIFLRIEHGKALFELIETDKEKHYVAGETDKDQREVTRQFAEKNDVIIVASLGVFSTGINIKNLHNLVFAHPTKSEIKVLQSIGRILRKSDDGRPSTVYDIVDDLKHGTRDNFALKHAAERMEQYIAEQFIYNIKSIQL